MSKKRQKDEKFIEKVAEKVYSRIENKLPKQWLRTRDVCEMLSISQATLQQARINGDFPATQLSTGTWLYPYAGVVEALESKTRGGKGSGHD